MDLVKYLVKCKADINKKNKFCKASLYSAWNSENKDLLIYLVENGAVINKGDEFIETLLIKAIENGNKDLVKYLGLGNMELI